jgi:hypothetical protein
LGGYVIQQNASTTIKCVLNSRLENGFKVRMSEVTVFASCNSAGVVTIHAQNETVFHSNSDVSLAITSVTNVVQFVITGVEGERYNHAMSIESIIVET